MEAQNIIRSSRSLVAASLAVGSLAAAGSAEAMTTPSAKEGAHYTTASCIDYVDDPATFKASVINPIGEQASGKIAVTAYAVPKDCQTRVSDAPDEYQFVIKKRGHSTRDASDKVKLPNVGGREDIAVNATVKEIHDGNVRVRRTGHYYLRGVLKTQKPYIMSNDK